MQRGHTMFFIFSVIVRLFLAKPRHELADVALHLLVLRAVGVGRVLAHHLYKVAHGVLVGRQLVLHLHAVLRQFPYLAFALSP